MIRKKASSRRFVSGETRLYLGRQYRLKVIKCADLPAGRQDVQISI